MAKCGSECETAITAENAVNFWIVSGVYFDLQWGSDGRLLWCCMRTLMSDVQKRFSEYVNRLRIATTTNVGDCWSFKSTDAVV